MSKKRRARDKTSADRELTRGVGGSRAVTTSDPVPLDGLRDEIQAAIAAGREVGPDMDRHLADSVLDRYRTELAARKQLEQVLVPSPPKPVQQRIAGTNRSETVLALAGLGAVVAIIIWQPHLWWVIFFLPGILGAWGWNRRSRH